MVFTVEIYLGDTITIKMINCVIIVCKLQYLILKKTAKLKRKCFKNARLNILLICIILVEILCLNKISRKKLL